EWAPCSVSCGAGAQKRLRQCNNPLPANGGRHCAGSDLETCSCQGKPCPGEIDGNWASWQPWGECSASCGGGERTHVRLCNSPSPSNGGRPCPGDSSQLSRCNTQACPVHGGYSEWAEWAPCSVSCGAGAQKRLRQCNNPLPANGGRHCAGSDLETCSCQGKPCPVAGNWGSWLPWSPCSETCGKGMQSRIRLCNNPPPAFDGPQCEGTDTQTQVCKERPCPGKACSVSCGGGTRQRTRLFASPTPQHGGRQCEGNDVHIDFCNSELFLLFIFYSVLLLLYHRCPVYLIPFDGNWASWQPWGECSASCGGGERTHVRLCNSPSPSNGGRPCPGDSSQLSRCNTQACPGKACHKSAVSVCGPLYTCGIYT
uniref:Complement factor properdin n=1 Tax=Amphiprion percula TaxID=161767 RepID=A0A3P8RV43_AMPPE